MSEQFKKMAVRILNFKSVIFTLGLVLVLPLSSVADPLNGGISHGIGNFLYVVFRLVTPSIIWIVLFLIQAFKGIQKFTQIIYGLGIYLIFMCAKYLKRYLYLYERRSGKTTFPDFGPDHADEKWVIWMSILGLAIIVITLAYVLHTDLKSRKS